MEQGISSNRKVAKDAAYLAAATTTETLAALLLGTQIDVRGMKLLRLGWNAL